MSHGKIPLSILNLCCLFCKTNITIVLNTLQSAHSPSDAAAKLAHTRSVGIERHSLFVKPLAGLRVPNRQIPRVVGPVRFLHKQHNGCATAVRVPASFPLVCHGSDGRVFQVSSSLFQLGKQSPFSCLQFSPLLF